MENDIVCLIGDVHGQVSRLKQTIGNVEKSLGSEKFARTIICFLGDYVDRGEDAKGALDYLIELRTKRGDPNLTRFVMGNHDFSMAGFLGCLHLPDDVKACDVSSTWKTCDEYPEDTLWSGPGMDEVHLQGRRWGGWYYNAETTFASYGVEFGDRNKLLEAVPQHHMDFLNTLPWVQDFKVSFGRFIVVHAGLRSDVPLDEQLKVLNERNPLTQRLPQLHNRSDVFSLPPELAGTNTLLVSGHHHIAMIGQNEVVYKTNTLNECPPNEAEWTLENSKEAENRIIWDPSGGFNHEPFEALLISSLNSTEWIRIPDSENFHLDTSEMKFTATASHLHALTKFDPQSLKSTTTRVRDRTGKTVIEEKGEIVQVIDSGSGQFMVEDTSEDKELHHVINGLFISALDGALNLEQLLDKKITHIVNAAYGVECKYPDRFIYRKLQLLDNEDADIQQHFHDTNCFIQEAVDSGGNVLVHCQMGVSRSASLVLAYLISRHTHTPKVNSDAHSDEILFPMTYDQALKFLRKVRPCVKPNDGFTRQLKTFERTLSQIRTKV